MIKIILAAFAFFSSIHSHAIPEISFTIDDPNLLETPLKTAEARNKDILAAFDRYKISTALFVCGMRVDNNEGKKIIDDWDKKGHLIAHHSYSHLNLNVDSTTIDVFKEDFIRGEAIISSYQNFSRIFRFPFLKEGETKVKRDAIRKFLKSKSYKHGHVTIDASDWYIEMKLKEALIKNPKADIDGYKKFYLDHIWERAQFYNELAKKVFKREVKHTLLLHHNLLNSLFLSDLMQMFQDRGWRLISAKEAFADAIFNELPDIVPAGEGVIWAKAKESGLYNSSLRYPAEDGKYEENKMKKLKL